MKRPRESFVRPANVPAAIPIYQSSGWLMEDLAQADQIFDGEVAGATYATLGGVPNQTVLEGALRDEHGAPDCVATSGGMSALNAVFSAHLQPGARIVVSKDLFGLTLTLLDSLRRWGVDTVQVDTTDITAVDQVLEKGTTMLLVETISNPLTRVPDLSVLSALTREREAKLVVDNTFAGPFHSRPLSHGADLVVESVTKSLSGHHDAVLGAVLGAPESLAPVRTALSLSAGYPAPFVAWLGHRGIASYHVRQARASESAIRLASWLEGRLEVTRVHYPGLTSHRDHRVAKRLLQDGYGSTMAFELATDLKGVETFLKNLRHIPLLMSLGGTQTSITHPGRTTHRTLSSEKRAEMGIADGLLRLAIGLEPVDHLMADLGQAFDHIS